MTRLHASFAINAIVEDDDREIARLLDSDGRERTETHQHLSVARNRRNATLWLCQGESQANHRGAAHRAPQIKIPVVVARGGDIPSGRAGTGTDQKIIAPVRPRGS